MRADIRVRIRSAIIRIQIERSCLIAIIPIATEIENVRSIEIAIIWPKKDFLVKRMEFFQSEAKNNKPEYVLRNINNNPYIFIF